MKVVICGGGIAGLSIRRHAAAMATALFAGAGFTQGSVLAQQPRARCAIICAPSLNLEPTVTVENLLGRHRVENVASGEITRADRAAQFELIIALDIPTTIPRVGLTFEAIWAPFAGRSSNPFTGATAAEIGKSQIRDNPVELEFNLHALEPETTGGWVGAHLDVVDQFSPAQRPDAAGAYTHKLDFELDVALAPFNFLKTSWLRHLEVEASFDYLATGLPRAGDLLPIGGERYLDDASPWALSFVLVLPIAPLGG